MALKNLKGMVLQMCLKELMLVKEEREQSEIKLPLRLVGSNTINKRKSSKF